ncbi:MAG: hypothetical protein ACXW3S_13405, partial [Rhodoplanes sp.]
DRDLAIRELTDDDAVLWVRRRVASVFGKSLFSETLRLDGLVSVWHPQAQSAANGSPAPF